MHRPQHLHPILELLLAGSLLVLGACAKQDVTQAAKHDARDEAKAYYAAHPDFFHFKTPADLPANLEWEDGSDLPEFADPAAKKGGTLNYYIPDFPRTLRTVGPDSNGSFRSWILDDNVMLYARRHPNITSLTKNGFHYYPGVAEKWALDRATKTVYIKLDPAARWSDGVPITSAGRLLVAA
jgi:microcin C transport system substrate-binding protein